MTLTKKQINYLKRISGKELWALKGKMGWDTKKFGEICEIYSALKSEQEELVKEIFKNPFRGEAGS